VSLQSAVALPLRKGQSEVTQASVHALEVSSRTWQCMRLTYDHFRAPQASYLENYEQLWLLKGKEKTGGERVQSAEVRLCFFW
jgi:hypothetical protein